MILPCKPYPSTIGFRGGEVKPACRPLAWEDGCGRMVQGMEKIRGILMLAVGAFALYRGFVMFGRASGWLAITLGIVAIALGVFRLTRKAPRRLV